MRRVPFKRDPEFYFLVFYNLMILGLYAFGKVEPMFVIWAYYLQSVFLGLQFFIREIVSNFRLNNSLFPLKKHSMAGFFLIHYGGFHAVYFIFLVVMSADLDADAFVQLIKEIRYTFLFLVANLILYTGRQVIPTSPDKYQPSMFLAYVRILPMHLVIIIGLNVKWGIDGFIVFMILKLIFDFVMYYFTGGEYEDDPQVIGKEG